MEETDDRDDRTIYVGGLSDKMSEKILYELFFQAGPIERVSIPKEKDGKLKNFGFVTFKHLVSVGYALNIFSGLKLYGREVVLRNRNANQKSSVYQQQQNSYQQSVPLSLMHGSISTQNNDINLMPNSVQQQIQQQLLLMASSQSNNIQQYWAAGNQMFGALLNANNVQFPSGRSDNAGSSRESVADRNRRSRDERHSNVPYRRSRSRSPHSRDRDRSRSPKRRRFHDSKHSGSGGGYQRWKY